jgi:23S rRNA (guanine745-N1)-methyltransferase
MSLFICPICGAPLTRGEHAYTCPRRHSYDIAKEGHTHLLPANRKHSKMPGDDKGMAAARSAFLGKGYYEPLRRALCDLACSLTGDAPALLDTGCGEGYYTGGVYHALCRAGKRPRMAGIDISKFILRLAARRERDIEFAVASSYHLPVADGSIELLLNCFSPLALEEFRRVLVPGGHFLYVVPSARHLWEMKQVLYDRPYLNEVKETPYEGFRYVTISHVETTIHLESQEDIHALFQMTPYYWKTPRAGAERLAALSVLDTTIAFDIHVFRRD